VILNGQKTVYHVNVGNIGCILKFNVGATRQEIGMFKISDAAGDLGIPGEGGGTIQIQTSNANVEFLFLLRPPARPQSLQLQYYL
jgi:hypothetical protein